MGLFPVIGALLPWALHDAPLWQCNVVLEIVNAGRWKELVADLQNKAFALV
jgi:hypothetical protein